MTISELEVGDIFLFCHEAGGVWQIPFDYSCWHPATSRRYAVRIGVGPVQVGYFDCDTEVLIVYPRPLEEDRSES